MSSLAQVYPLINNQPLFLKAFTQDSPRPALSRSASRPRMPSHPHPQSGQLLSHVPVLSPTFEECARDQTVPLAPSFRSSRYLSASAARPIPRSSHSHTDSTSTSASDSAGSSPTTAPSLTESVQNSETPTTSPDTPASNNFTSSHPSPVFALARRPATIESHQSLARPQPGPFDLPRPSTGLKGKRNLKNLAVDTNSATAFGRAISTATLPLNHGDGFSALGGGPTSSQPRFLRNKRSALGLTLVTPSTAGPSKLDDSGPVPPTPSLVRPHALRHFPSSPSLVGRDGDAQQQSRSIPPGSLDGFGAAGRRTSAISVGFHPPPTTHEEDEDEQDFDVPQSQEAKPEAYPDGPICIYDPHVYLYYEPSAEQASKFDTIINVAEEVPNPFRPQSAESANDTPRASTPLYKEPEYVHMPWQHNTDIVPDLARLSALIDDRVKEGKSVLIHCQCGVSRSASLIVAYGLFKNPSMTVQEAYDAVKRRSKWINPNMSLIMQLQEFRTQTLKTSAGMPSRSLLFQAGGLSPLEAKGAIRVPARPKLDEPGAPKSAPLKNERRHGSLSDIATSEHGSVTPGPSSAPSGFPWLAEQDVELSDKDLARLATNSSQETLKRKPSMLSAIINESKPESQAAPTSHPRQSPSPKFERRPSPIKLPSSQFSKLPAAGLDSIRESPVSSNGRPSFDEAFGLGSPHPEPSLRQTLLGGRSSSSMRNPPMPDSAPPPPPLQTKLPLRESSAVPFTPRGAEFGMSGVKAPSFGDSFGLMSPAPRKESAAKPKIDTAAVASSNSTSKPDSGPPRLPPLDFQPLSPQSQGATSSLTGALASPRSDTFAMNSIIFPAAEDMFGLSSPRVEKPAVDFPPRNTSRATAISALHPESAAAATTEAQKAGDRAKLRSKLGMSTSSSYDMRSEYVLAAKARELRPTIPPPEYRQSRTLDDLPDALMSPRATEFTANPFRDFLSSAPAKGSAANTPKKADPRSPAQKGASPIIRNILDVIS